jgi:CRP-like cAMP-binding protein
MHDRDFNSQKSIKNDNSPDISSLIVTLSHFYPLSEGMKEFFKKHSYSCTFQKGKLLLKAGDICQHIYFIKKGVVRGFIKEADRDITTWITADNELVTSISGLDNKEPAAENMQAIEDCEMLALSFADVQTLYAQFPDFNILIRKLLQKYYQDAEGRAYIARLTNAENKYHEFLSRYGHLSNRVPLKYIASFLGMTLETLSRVRKRLSAKKE